MSGTQRRILVDVSKIARGDARTGIQRVVRAILRQLMASPPAGYDIVPVRAGRWRGYRYAAESCAALLGTPPGAGLEGKVRAAAGDIFFALDFAPGILPRHEAELAAWRALGVRMYFFVYDLLPLSQPQWFSAAGARNYAAWMSSLLRNADGAVCSSRAVAVELGEWLRANRGPGDRQITVDWAHLGADIGESVPSEGLPSDFERRVAGVGSSAMVLMVGTLEPRKGHAQALSAFEILWRQGRQVNLVVVGNAGWKVRELVQRLRRHPEAGKRLLWLEGASDEALCRLYQRADGVLIASEAEGFGLPMVEAAAYGKPILARDIPVCREVAGEQAMFFDSREPAVLARDLERWLDLIGRGAAPSSAAIRTSTWSESARKICAALRIAA